MQMNLQIRNKKGIELQPDMIGLFFEDINYAADGGLYAEMLENRSFEFLEAFGDAGDYYTVYDGSYGWSAYPSAAEMQARTVMGSPLTEENPHYMRLKALKAGAGIKNKAYDGIYMKKGMHYKLCFWVRNVSFDGSFILKVEKAGEVCGEAVVCSDCYKEETYHFFRDYETELTAEADAEAADFIFALSQPGTVELDFISMMPADAVEGIFRRDLFEKLKALKPGFLRFPGGCIVEGNTLHNRYRYKDTLKPAWARKNNWNRWAVHGNCAENDWHGSYSHYNQSLGLGYYEYFILCEKIGAKAIPVMNVGFACQYQSAEILSMEDEQWQEFLQDALDLIEFANGDCTTRWGSVREKLGHAEPFGLTMLGIGNEQWQTPRADFFERYTRFETAIHEKHPQIRLIGSAGPDVTSQHYTDAWHFYRGHAGEENFVYAVDEHYYVKPEWLFEHVDFYDAYDRRIKVFSGEYAAHPCSGMNMPEANNLEGALAEAAFLTGVERNGDVVVLASYAPLFARLGYAQWSPDMIWFDARESYGTPSYYVQLMYGNAVGDYTLLTKAEAVEEKIYYSVAYQEKEQDIIIKIVNANEEEKRLRLAVTDGWKALEKTYRAQILTGDRKNAVNSISEPEKVFPYETEGNLEEELCLPPLSFSVIRVKAITSEMLRPGR